MIKKEIGFGTYQMSAENTIESVKEAINQGYDFIDTAFKYENEELVGQGIRNSLNPKIRIQTKIWITHMENVEEQLIKQLQLLGVKKIWSLLLHRPTLDFNESIKGWKKFVELKKKGLVEHIGVSNFDKDMINLIYRDSGVMPEINQIELSITNFREDRVYFCKQKNIIIQAWTPLGVSALKNPIVIKMANKYNATPAQICIAFLLEQGIVPLVKSENALRIKENINSKKICLDKEDINILKTQNIYENKASETFYYK